MNNILMTFNDDETKALFNKLNPNARRIFDWLCTTFNAAAHIPHIYECGDNKLVFIVRKAKGCRIKLNKEVMNKIVSFSNFIFRIKQPEWPVRYEDDIQGSQILHVFTIKTNGAAVPIIEEAA